MKVAPGLKLRIHMVAAVSLVAAAYMLLLGVLVRLGVSLYLAAGLIVVLVIAHLWATNSIYWSMLSDGSTRYERFGMFFERARYWNRQLRPWLIIPLLPLIWWLIWSHQLSEIAPYAKVAVALLVVELPLFAFVRYRNRGRNGPLPRPGRVPAPVREDSRAAEAARLLATLCQRAGTPTPHLFILSSNAANAWAMGWTPRAGVIGVTFGLLGTDLTSEELETVLAHELSHLLNGDSAILQLASVPAVLARFMFEALAENPARGLSGLASLVLAAAVYPFVVLSVLITLPLSRQREYSADRAAALLTGNPSAAIAALQKITGRIERTSRADLAPLRPAASLMFAKPSGAGTRRRLRALFSTHPSLDNRVIALRKVAIEMKVASTELADASQVAAAPIED